MKESTNFPIAIYQYLTTIEIKDMEGDGFVLLTQIFDAAHFSNVTNGNLFEFE